MVVSTLTQEVIKQQWWGCSTLARKAKKSLMLSLSGAIGDDDLATYST